MRPYEPSKSVGDIKRELPHYYCNLHNPDPDTYPAEPGKSVTIVEVPPVLPPEENEDQPATDPDNPNPDGDNPSDDPDTDPTPPDEGGDQTGTEPAGWPSYNID